MNIKIKEKSGEFNREMGSANIHTYKAWEGWYYTL